MRECKDSYRRNLEAQLQQNNVREVMTETNMTASKYKSLSFSDDEETPLGLPPEYELLQTVYEGDFGKVMKCWNKITERNEDLKVPSWEDDNTRGEISMMKVLKRHNLDQHNIVKFYGVLNLTCGIVLVFEALESSTSSWRCPTVALCSWMAAALEALKSIDVIHTNVNTENIMLVRHQRRPFKVKLTNFGEAIPTSKATKGRTLQTLGFRSPEILLGLPFSEAIDMFSLGCVMAAMILDCLLFQEDDHEYLALREIIELLGQPADHVLDKGKHTKNYFNRIKSKTWRLKTHVDYWGFTNVEERSRFQTLDDLKKVCLEKEEDVVSEDAERCIELLKATLRVDVTERISPSQVLTHPFITEDFHRSQCPIMELHVSALRSSSPPTVLLFYLYAVLFSLCSPLTPTGRGRWPPTSAPGSVNRCSAHL
ncbi:homeodomain-interacting protein kinase 2-like [Embiotoca jacksoni]|uniref:homeodomain-interacting protein kinase 2-like n=1 Tax=Embiotoca jacksoni TaxID=100190 RepID=UPI003703FA99